MEVHILESIFNGDSARAVCAKLLPPFNSTKDSFLMMSVCLMSFISEPRC